MSKTRNLSRILGADGALDIQSTATYVSTANLPTSGNTEGDQAYVSGNNRLYMWNGSGWYNIALINTTPTFDSGGVPNSTYTLDAEVPQESITITLGASDPEEIPLTYSYVTGGSMDSMATISQDSSVFTITPKTFAQLESDAGPHTGTITFSATDGINILPATSQFTLTFITQVPGSSSTTLLAKASGTGNNATPVDASTSSHTLSVGGEATMGGFSPYRHGGYSHYFDGSSDYLRDDTIADAFDTVDGHCDNFTIELWFYTTVDCSNDDYMVSSNALSNGANDFLLGIKRASWNGTVIGFDYGELNTHINTWHHIVCVHDHDPTGANNEAITVYIDGKKVFKETGLARISFANNAFAFGAEADSSNFGTIGNYLYGYIHDVKITKLALYDTSNDSIPVPAALSKPHPTANIFHGFQDGSIDKRFTGPNGTGTRSGNVACLPFTPLDYDAYKTANGGAINFPGSDDEVITTDAATNQVVLGSGDFTIEFWIHKNNPDASGWQAILSQKYHETGGWRIYKNSSSDDFTWYSNSSSILQSSGTGIMRAGEWRHIALVRESGTLTWYSNGKNYGSTSNTTDYTGNTNGEIEIGKGTHYSEYPTNSAYSDLRIVVGTAVYTGEFTPPIAPLTTVGGTYPSTTNITDPIPAGNTKLLLNFNNAKIIDKSQSKFLTLTGNTAASSAVTHYGENTMYFDGTGYAHTDGMTSQSTPVFNEFDFTVEAWVYPASLADYRYIFGTRSSAESVSNFHIGTKANGQVYFFINGQFIIESSHNISATTWSHIVLTKRKYSGSDCLASLYVNGNYSGDAVIGNDFSDEGYFIGGDSFSSLINWVGHIHDVRVSHDKVRYPYDSRPVTLTQTNSGMETDGTAVTVSSASNTLFLGCHASTIVDGSSNAVTVTANGNAAVSSFHPPGVSGLMHSVKFDGTGDYLSATTAAALGTTDWTIEYWVWHDNLTSANQIHLAFGAYSPAFYYRHSSAKFAMYQSGSSFSSNYITTHGPPKKNTWYHLAWVHDDSANKVTLFMDGAYVGQYTYTGNISSTSLRIGDDTTGAYMNGYISNLRIVQEKLYDRNFTPPSKALST